jgi:carboxypeptidase family protein
VPGATVTVTDTEKGKRSQATTNPIGQYTINVPAPAKVDVDVLKDGFQVELHKGIAISVGQTTTVDFHMKVSQAVESVEVTTEPPVVERPGSEAAPIEIPLVTVPVIRGIVVPSDVRAGEEISGLVVPDPDSYKNIPGLHVVPIPAAGTSELQGMVIDIGDGRKQPARGPLIMKVPELAAPLTMNVFLLNQPGKPIAQGTLPVQSAAKIPPGAAAPGPLQCTMPPIATPGGIQIIQEAHNRTSGNSPAMKVSVDDKPATIVAASPGKVFYKVPDLPPGPHQVIFTPGPGEAPVNLQMRVLNLQMSAAKTALVRGESTTMTVTITGLEGLPASAWQSAPPPADLVNVESVQQRAKGFHAPKPQEPGTVLLLLENDTPAQIRMGKEGIRIVLQLHQKDFAQGPYIYQDRIQSLRSGGFSITGTLVPFLKDVQGNQ